MFILVNSKPVNILNIDRISGIINVTDAHIYESCVKNLKIALDELDISESWNTDNRVRGRCEVKILKFINDALKAIDIPEGIKGGSSGNPSLYGLKLPYEIPWEKVPDGFFFQILFKEKDVNTQLETSVDSKVYLNKEEATKAQERLLNTINGLYFELPKLEI